MSNEEVMNPTAAQKEAAAKVRREIEDSSLKMIQDFIRDINTSWYKSVASEGIGLSTTCFVSLYQALEGYPELTSVSTKLAKIYNDLNKNQNEILPMLNESIAWLDTEKTDNDLTRCKVFLVFAKITYLKINNSWVAKQAIGSRLAELNATLNTLTEAATRAIERIAPAKTIEELLNNHLPDNPITIKDFDARKTALKTVQDTLEEHANLLEKFATIKATLHLFQINDTNISKRQYFASLIGAKAFKNIIDDAEDQQRREKSFDDILETCTEEEKVHWREVQRTIKEPTPAQKTTQDRLAMLSTVFNSPIEWTRTLATYAVVQNVVDSTLVKPWLEKAQPYFETVDSDNKKNFIDLLERQIVQISQKIAQADDKLTAELKLATPKKLKELAEKTRLISKLYAADLEIKAFLEKNNHIGIKLSLFIAKYLKIKGPVADLVLQARGYQRTITELKTSFFKSEHSTERKIAELETHITMVQGNVAQLKENFGKIRPAKDNISSQLRR